MQMTGWFTAAGEPRALKADLQARLAECHLELHPVKTRIVYCKDVKRNAEYPKVTFDFLGYCFRPRLVKNTRNRQLFCGFNPAVSPAALKEIRSTIKSLQILPTNATYAGGNRPPSQSTPAGMNPQYSGRFTPSALEPIYRHVNLTLLRWARQKFKRFAVRPTRGWPLSRAASSETGRSLCTLASRNGRSVSLMGAV